MQEIGIGIIGAGFSADLHASSLHRIAGRLRNVSVEVVGVASRNKDRAQAFAKKNNIPFAYTDYHSLLERDEISVIDICVPNHLHKSLAIEAAQAGKHIICEKPLTGYFGENFKGPKEFVSSSVSKLEMLKKASRNAQEMVNAARSNNVKLMYAENWIYAPAIEKAKRLIKASGGTLFEIRAEESHSGSHSKYSKQWKYSGGGSLMRLGAHPIGAAIHLKNCEGLMRDGKPIRVKSIIATTGNLTKISSFVKEPKKWVVSDWEDVEDWGTAILTFTDGSKATVITSDCVLGGVRNKLEICLSNAYISCNMSPNTCCEVFAPDERGFQDEYITEKTETKAGWSFPSPDEDWARGYPQEMEDFIESVVLNRDPISDADLARQVIEVIYASYLSAEERSEVELANVLSGKV
ncbi:Gfo/Idh/MocA family oxidoreductase [Candidatus Aerophobetes bacterium]|uniref:Gfo/Idh/MocA family oxidoreductase n=1 Tax=Aerophobetes bacterium TaxID=2030807 RepID=A0A523W536_UNCAE|nr:MAG: Gfo/Idh/MocA family oxidoreductase [Candidatus Aerophobetes bacterium]